MHAIISQSRLILILLFIAPTASGDLRIDNLLLESKTRINRTEFEYAYRTEILNTGLDAFEVQASVSSESPYTAVSDNVINFGFVPGNSRVVSDDIFYLRHNRRVPFDQGSLNWDMSYLEMEITSQLPEIDMIVGQSDVISHVISITNNTNADVLITFKNQMEPSTGVEIINNIPGPINVMPNGQPHEIQVNQELSSKIPGIYNASLLVENNLGSNISDKIQLNIYQNGKYAKTSPISSWPDGVQINEPSNVTFSVSITGSDSINITNVVLEEITENGDVKRTLGEMLDDGDDGDLLKNDYIFSKLVEITEWEEGKVYFRAIVTIDEIGTLESPAFILPATRFSNEVKYRENIKIVFSDKLGTEILNDELLVSFKKGVTSEAISSIVETIGGEVTGTIPAIETYQIIFPTTENSDAVVLAKMKALSVINEVESVEPIVVFRLESTPNDWFYQTTSGSTLQNPLISMSPELAWTKTQGEGTIISVIDSGCDFTHPDLLSPIPLATKLIQGTNYTDLSNQPVIPNDTNGHGTHVTGIRVQPVAREYVEEKMQENQ